MFRNILVFYHCYISIHIDSSSSSGGNLTSKTIDRHGKMVGLGEQMEDLFDQEVKKKVCIILSIKWSIHNSCILLWKILSGRQTFTDMNHMAKKKRKTEISKFIKSALLMRFFSMIVSNIQHTKRFKSDCQFVLTIHPKHYRNYCS